MGISYALQCRPGRGEPEYRGMRHSGALDAVSVQPSHTGWQLGQSPSVLPAQVDRVAASYQVREFRLKAWR
jgi:hypothetical protein